MTPLYRRKKQEKNITYPTDSKLAIKIINRLNKLAKQHGIKQRRTFVKEVKNCRLRIRHFRHVKKRTSAKKALKRLRTIAHILIRELQRKLPQHCLFETCQADFLFYQWPSISRRGAQRFKDKNNETFARAGILFDSKEKAHGMREFIFINE